MTYKVTVKYPGLPEGDVFTISGLGAFENGVEREIDEDTARQFFEVNGYNVEEMDNPNIVVEKVKETKKSKAAKEEEAPEEPAEEEGGAE